MKQHHSIIIVDDDEDDRTIIKDAFENSIKNHECISFENGDKLLEYLQHEASHPSLIMLDLNLPGRDGREILKELKTNSRFQHIPVIVFTTSSFYKDKQTVYNLGANCFITKPDTFKDLVDLTSSVSKLWLT